MRITRHEEFEVAHILPDYLGPCGNLHGHTYKIEVTVEGPQDFEHWGMVLDFNKLKYIIKEVVPDHRFIYNSKDISPVEADIIEVLKKHNCRFIGYPFATTAENMVSYFAECIEKEIHQFSNDINVVEVKLWETTNSYAQYIKKED